MLGRKLNVFSETSWTVVLMLARKTFTGFPRRAFGALILLSPVVPQHNLIFPFCSFTIMKAWTHSKHLISKIFLCHVAIFPHHDIMIFPHPCPTLTCSWCWWRGAGWWSPWHLSWWADPAYPPTFSQTYLVVVVVSVLGHTNIFASIPSSLSIGPLTSLLCHHVWDNVDRDGEDNLNWQSLSPFIFIITHRAVVFSGYTVQGLEVPQLKRWYYTGLEKE